MADGLQWSQDRPGGLPELSWGWPSIAAESTEYHTFTTTGVTEDYMFTPTVWLKTTCLYYQCNSGLHVYTNGVTQDYMFRPTVWLRTTFTSMVWLSITCLHSGVSQHYMFTPTVWLSTTRLHQRCDSGLHVYTNSVTQHYMFISIVYQQSHTLMFKVLTLEHFGFQARDKSTDIPKLKTKTN